MKKGNNKLLIRNLRKMNEQEQQKQALNIYDVSDLLDKIQSLNGYLKIWQRNETKPFELNDLIEEVDEWLESNGR